MSDFLTVKEFADRMKLSKAAVYFAIEEQRLQTVTILGRIGIPRSELSRFKRRKNGDKSKVLKAA